jgi:hypothetical protein
MERETMRRTSLALALFFAASPVLAQAPNHNWEKAGTDPTYGVDICVDRNSVIKSADGYVQFEMLLGCAGPDNQIFVEYVNCNEDMTGNTLVTKSYPYNESGSYDWATRQVEDTKSASLAAQSAKFVCAEVAGSSAADVGPGSK